jgi:hypothetical protein
VVVALGPLGDAYYPVKSEAKTYANLKEVLALALGLLCPTPRSADRARSLARVSEKREYFKCRPETIGDFAPKLLKLGV